MKPLYKKILFLLSVVYSLALSACGQNGPLYHPNQPPPIHVPDN